ncbi:MAG: Phosphotransferase system, fructose-specific IIC component [Chloroflexi bacterium AL-W]|nr:Phosphotransferase system, fructose-specific IIC component [Chloroflexi bacterium AL-N1]NOK69919.1 Phosphotransferase system, fructose-specific IIC component [Chloroflexi bacterium AL-N10]NOK73785.1 Phosphotransferase system, fructose-specific IIC component [Chloroflexi bacterium AL-N5]NOK85451.1 Phosphotransferase system, fructose-specific IIC component [Chloroflexi bacterium AL-W]NOK91652.1 Phosphotransferase system, fructose-specific IIC component [Chloroflexi bacterium AL-N15]
MTRIVAVTACPTGVAHTIMVAEALRKTAKTMGHEIMVETQGADDAKNVLSDQVLADAAVVILVTDIQVDRTRFKNKPIYQTRTSETIRHTHDVINDALELVSTTAPVIDTFTKQSTTPQIAPSAEAGKQLVGITSCPTGIAHTFMAAEALQKAARALGHSIKIETQGSVGSQNSLTENDIAQAYAAGKWVGVRGSIAHDPRGAIILAGLGVTELSSSIPAIAAIKARLRQVSFPQAQAMAQKALACTTATKVYQLPLI